MSNVEKAAMGAVRGAAREEQRNEARTNPNARFMSAVEQEDMAELTVLIDKHLDEISLDWIKEGHKIAQSNYNVTIIRMTQLALDKKLEQSMQEYHKHQQQQQQHHGATGQSSTSLPLQMRPVPVFSYGAPNIHQEKKKLYILNNIDFPEPIYSISGGNSEAQIISRREGASIDSQNLMSTFQTLGYDVILNENKTLDQTNTILDSIQQDQNLKFLLLIILSHGVDKDHFITSDGLPFSLNSIQQRFTDSGCPNLKGLPKIILSNFCRGTNVEIVSSPSTEQYIETDAALYSREVPHHMVMIQATHDGFAAMRNIRTGTIFVNNLCKVLQEQGHQPILKVFNEVHERIQRIRAQTPEIKISPPTPNFSF